MTIFESVMIVSLLPFEKKRDCLKRLPLKSFETVPRLFKHDSFDQERTSIRI